MSPYTDAGTELQLVVRKAQAAAAQLPAVSTPEQRENLRLEVLGDLLDAVDRIEPGAGHALMVAMYPLTAQDWHAEAAAAGAKYRAGRNGHADRRRV